jgi:hypothetical protein
LSAQVVPALTFEHVRLTIDRYAEKENMMAGDVGFTEGALFAGVRGALGAAALPVLHEYGANFRIGLGVSPGAAPAALSLSEPEQLGLKALNMRESQAYLRDKQARAYADRNWGTVERGGPQPLHRDLDTRDLSAPEDEISEVGAPPPGTSDRLSGRVAVAIIMVSGTHPGLGLSEDEQLKIVAEVQNGLSWLGAQSPAQDVTWVYEIHSVTVNVPNVTSGQTYEAFEAPWRDAALASLDLEPGLSGVRRYIQNLRTKLNTEWSYCAFFTKYTLRHFAYASLSGPRLVMHYDNDGWGSNNIDRVFAHETGHIFGAPDEYAASGCNCGGSHGHFGQRNGNCENCAPGGGVQCIMRANTWAMCSFTPLHLGYTDADAPPIS